VRLLLVSTYELGHQPLHAASPAGALLRAGHEVRCLDVSVEPLDPVSVMWADAIAVSVPMHTAARLALAVCERVRQLGSVAPLCLYGLYASLVGTSSGTAPADLAISLAISGEYEPRLVGWADDLEAGTSGAPDRRDARSAVVPGGGAGADTFTLVELGRGRFGLPARDLLPPLERYARAAAFGSSKLAGYVEASHGCAHRCRHCPVPVVYDGRTRIVGIDVLLADVAQLVDLGAGHLTFGDPDFLNGPHHALRVVSAVHDAFPDLSFDVTAKVEHILAHRELWPRMASAGCSFVVSAFESTSATVLGHLAKGHDASDEREAVSVLRSAGIEPRPSLLPFTPWTTAGDIVEILDLVAECDLVGNVDPIQYAIRLLVPPGSLLLESGALDGLVGPYDPEHLSFGWQSHDPRLDTLAASLSILAERAGTEGWSAAYAYDTARAETFSSLGLGAGGPRPTPDPRLRSAVPDDQRPKLTEAWFCCAEPTASQLSGALLETKFAADATADSATEGR
jgi:radical SAM superfamily enzyme YgiQ (UPF0313 family)